MPSLLHEEVIELLSRDPESAVELLRQSGKREVPPYQELRVESGGIQQVLPPERRVDVVVLLLDGAPVLVLLVEVQLSRDDEKRLTWPFYVPALRLRYNCPACLVVYALDPEVEAWARQPIDVGQPDSLFCPVVVGKHAFPKVTKVEEAVKAPYRAILSALAHADEEEAERVVYAAAVGSEGLPAAERDMWRELMAAALDDAARKALEAMMDVEKYKQQSVWVREALDEGKKLGLDEGRVAEARRAVSRVLLRRGLSLDAGQQQRLDGCSDLATLQRWLDRAVTASTVDEALS
jgi:hypothetical protein